MRLENITLENIDSYLGALTRDVGEGNVEFYRAYMLGAGTDHSQVLNLYLSWEKQVKTSWDTYKITSCPNSDIVKAYEEKIKKSDGYLALMKNIFEEDVAQKNQIKSLLERKLLSGLQTYVLLDDVDKAFELVKKMPWSGFSIEVLTDIFGIYISEDRLQYWEKAYEVVFYAQQQFWEVGSYVQPKLDQIIEKCLNSGIQAAEKFLHNILQHYPKCGNIFPPQKTYVPLSLRQLEDQLIAKGDKDAIAHREAEILSKNRKLYDAINKAESIISLVNRRSAFLVILDQCREFGDEETIKIALELSNHKDITDYRNGLLLNIIETCKKNRLKEIALEAADRIDLPKVKEKQLSKIHDFFSRSDIIDGSR